MTLIRETTLADLPALQQVAIQTQVDTFMAYNTEANMKAYLDKAYNLESLKMELQEPGSRNCLAFIDEELAGFVRLRESTEVEHLLGKNTIEMQRLYVMHKFHGRKVGATLMRDTLAYARSKKYEWLWLGVWEKNERAQTFYTRWGFERFSEHIFQMGDDPQTDWLLRRRV
jgi:ribosomal protein S18 acetylase RimI-like enzyme